MVREERRRKTIEKVIAAAAELFRTRGYDRTSIRDIDACEVSVGTVTSVAYLF